MATKTKIGLLIITAGIVLVVALAVRSTESAKDEFHFDAAKLKDHNTWIQVNAEPYRMSPAVAAMCAPVVLSEPMSSRNPHAAAFITVYVNKVGREAMFAQQAERFPEGSIIVKEKFKSPDDRKPLLYTIMRKRNAGYNPKVGDWEFSVVGADGTQLQSVGKLEKCQGCHVSKSESDFVYRPYVKTE